jgi:hypothetical protein
MKVGGGNMKTYRFSAVIEEDNQRTKCFSESTMPIAIGTTKDENSIFIAMTCVSIVRFW